uniref:Integrase zinc-binding domain-containing protein n=2 Tax=Strigops habroptila TaxID=2489341 RepID=A0A672UD49_STRHB
DSWSVANGLAIWLPTWATHDWKIHSKEVWGKELWQDIWAFAQQARVTVFHIDARCGADTLEQWYNSITDGQAKISQVVVEDPHHEQQMGLAKWAHQKCSHLGEKATYRWAQDRRIVINSDIIKMVIAQCPICQHTQQRTVPHIVRGQLNRGKLPGQIWQMDYIGPLCPHMSYGPLGDAITLGRYLKKD